MGVRAAVASVAATTVTGLSLAFVPSAAAQPVPRGPGVFKSDDRASDVVNQSDVSGKPTCAHWARFAPGVAGLDTATQAGWFGSSDTDGVIHGVVRPPGTAPTDHGTLDITVTPPDGAEVRVLAVIVFGGGGFQLYTHPGVLPPTLESPQRYLPPTNHGNNGEAIGQWLVCYTVTFPKPPDHTGNVAVNKVLKLPEGVAEHLPSGYTATVTCREPTGTRRHQTVRFSPGGGLGDPAPVFTPPLPAHTRCTVKESTGSLSPMPMVMITPKRVTIVAGKVSRVTITNTFHSVPAERGTVKVKKEVRNPHGARTPEHFFVDVACNGPSGTTTVRLPGTGGLGKPLHPEVGFACAVEEVQVPHGWTVRYLFNGHETDKPPIVEVNNKRPLKVTVINTAPALPEVPVTG